MIKYYAINNSDVIMLKAYKIKDSDKLRHTKRQISNAKRSEAKTVSKLDLYKIYVSL